MAIITDFNTVFGTIQPIAWLGKYAGSQGSQDFNGQFIVAGYHSTIEVVDFSSNAKLTHGFNTYFKLQGFNTTTGKYEVWFSKERPLLIPPSGNSLSNIEVILTWIDR